MAIVERNLARTLHSLAGHYPVVTVTGPRQSGKTTLCRRVFPEKPYVSLEALDVREYARDDPRGFLSEYAAGAIVDEVQHAPGLLSYLQVDVDARPEHGRFVLTGSQQLAVGGGVAQSLAGRTAVVHLLPPGLDELRRFDDPPQDLHTTLWMGAYPRIHDRGIPADRWLADYVATYVQRDVRKLLDVGDLERFTTFLRLCAGRTASEVNLSALGSDVGVSHNTVRSWLSVLEAGFLCFRLPAWRRSVRKQWIKAPKLHFFDTGLACHLLGIAEPEQLRHHPLRGAIFESWVAAEVYKARVHQGLVPRLYHYREPKGLEADLVVDRGESIVLAEAKSGQTVSAELLRPLGRVGEALARSGVERPVERRLVYGGPTSYRRSGVTVLSWSDLPWGPASWAPGAGR